jgi:lipid II:glycine glycyltransferase (peptidoglycan interpeptide bridge formation enzyme)
MALEIIIDDITKAQWQNYAKDFADYSIYQTWAYQQVRAETARQKLSRFVIKDGSQAAVMGQVRIMNVRPLGLRVGYVQWGPLLRGKDGDIRVSVEAMDLLRKSYLGSCVNILRLVPNVQEGENSRNIVHILERSGFAKVLHAKPYHTIMLWLEASEEQLRKNLHQKWRNRLNKAEKAGLTIEQGTDGQYFCAFESLYRLTVERKNFMGLDVEIFAKSHQYLDAEEKMNFVVAYYNGEPVSANFSSCLGDTAVAILAAGNDTGLKYEASNLIWWQWFLLARRAGMKMCDLGGIDPVNNPGVYQFKSRVGGKEVCYIGTFEACTGSFLRRLWHVSERLHNVIKRKK